MKLLQILIFWQVTYLHVNCVPTGITALKCEFTPKEREEQGSFKCATKEFISHEEGAIEIDLYIKEAPLQDNVEVIIYENRSGNVVIRRQVFKTDTDFIDGTLHLEHKITEANLKYYIEIITNTSRETISTLQVKSIRYISSKLNYVKDNIKSAVIRKYNDDNVDYGELFIAEDAIESRNIDVETTGDLATPEMYTETAANPTTIQLTTPTPVEEELYIINHPLTITLIVIVSLIAIVVIVMCGLYFLYPKRKTEPTTVNDRNAPTLVVSQL